jgi:hypothetical protein
VGTRFKSDNDDVQLRISLEEKECLFEVFVDVQIDDSCFTFHDDKP